MWLQNEFYLHITKYQAGDATPLLAAIALHIDVTYSRYGLASTIRERRSGQHGPAVARLVAMAMEGCLDIPFRCHLEHRVSNSSSNSAALGVCIRITNRYEFNPKPDDRRRNDLL